MLENNAQRDTRQFGPTDREAHGRLRPGHTYLERHFTSRSFSLRIYLVKVSQQWLVKFG